MRSLALEGPVAGGGPQSYGEIHLGIDYLVKHSNGHKKLIPSQVTSFQYLYMPVSCDQSNFQASGFATAGVEVTKKRFSYRYMGAWGDIQSTVQLTGQKMWQGRTKWRGQKPKPPGRKFYAKMASGVLNIIDWDWATVGALNCTTNGPRSWSAHQCLHLSTDPSYLPPCDRAF